MTFSKQELRDTIQNYSDLHPLQIEVLLSKLDEEDLETLDYLINDVRTEGINEGERFSDNEAQSDYDEGYKDGYTEGLKGN